MTTWTPQQEAFLTALTTTEDCLILDAKAGSGKTTTIVEGVRRVVSTPGTPKRILMLAFNVKIKKELEARVQGADCKTLNGLGHSALMRMLGKKSVAVEGGKVGNLVSAALKSDRSLDPDLWSPVTQLVAKAKTHGLVPEGSPGTPVGIIPDTFEDWKDLAATYDLDFSKDIWDLARTILIRSTEIAFEGVIDFDDQIYLPVVYRAGFPQYDLVFVDEAQDLNDLQHVILNKVRARPRGRIIAVGDPFQAIYGFRGARHDSMEKLAADFSATVMPLSVSFRCAKAIIRHAQSDVPDIEAADGAAEGKVTRLDTWSVTDFKAGDAIGCRNVAPLLSLAYACLHRRIPVKFLGRDIGAGLKALIKKLAGKPSRLDLQSLEHAIQDWAAREAANARSSGALHRIDSIYDKANSLLAIMDSSGVESVEGLYGELDQLFQAAAAKITLMTGHGSKGLEFDRFYILDPWRIPSRYAKMAGDDFTLNTR